MSNGRVSIFIAGVLVLAAAGTAVHFHAKYRRVEAERRLDAKRILDLEAELTLVRAEVSEYQEKLRQAGEIADGLERERDAKERIAREHSAKIDELEAKLAAMTEPPPEEPPVVALVEETTPTAGESNDAGRETSTTTADTEPTIAMTVSAHDEAASPRDAQASRLGAEAERSDLERELEEVRAEKRELEMKHAALVGEQAEGVPLGKVRVTTGLRLKGKVLVVNERYGFVVVDLGARDGVEKGMVLILHRGRKFIGKCQVSKVYNRMVAADLILDWMKDEVQVGDGVRKF